MRTKPTLDGIVAQKTDFGMKIENRPKSVLPIGESMPCFASETLQSSVHVHTGVAQDQLPLLEAGALHHVQQIGDAGLNLRLCCL